MTLIVMSTHDPSLGLRTAALALLAGACASPATPGEDGKEACTPGSERACYTGPDGTQDVGACVAGVETCDADGVGYGPCEGEITPAAEQCDTPADESCDGAVNEADAGCICEAGATQACYTGPLDTEGVGVCAGGTATCAGGTSWGACAGETTPKADDCANLDDEDCDGIVCSAPVWSAMFGGSGNDRALAVAVDASGNTYLTGKFTGIIDFGGGPLASEGGDDAFLLKLDPQGAHVWSRRFGDVANQYGTAVAVGPTGNVILGGYFAGSIAFNVTYTASAFDGFLVELDPDGQPLWSARLGGAGDDKLWSLAIGPSGEIAAAGTFNGTHHCTTQLPPTCKVSAGGDDVFVRVYTAGGTLQSVHAFGSTEHQGANGVAVDSAGKILLTGQFQGTLDFGDGSAPLNAATTRSKAFLAKLDPMGTGVLWSHAFGDTDNDHRGIAVAVDAADQPVMAGSFEGTIAFDVVLSSAGGTDVFVAKLDPDGQSLWSRSYGNLANQQAQGVAYDPEGNVLLTGGFEGVLDFGGGGVVSGGSYDLFLVKLAPLGEHRWSKGFGNVSAQFGFGVTADPTTSQVVTVGYAAGTVDFGSGQHTAAGAEDIVVARFQP
jgi:hypothetical protein